MSRAYAAPSHFHCESQDTRKLTHRHTHTHTSRAITQKNENRQTCSVHGCNQHSKNKQQQKSKETAREGKGRKLVAAATSLLSPPSETEKGSGAPRASLPPPPRVKPGRSRRTCTPSPRAGPRRKAPLRKAWVAGAIRLFPLLALRRRRSYHQSNINVARTISYGWSGGGRG